MPRNREEMRQLIDAIVLLSSDLELSAVLTRLIEAAAELTGAPYGAVHVLDARGRTQMFIQHGLDGPSVRSVGHPPLGMGVLGLIPSDGTLVLDDVSSHTVHGGFPPGHPTMTTFLGVAVRVRRKVFGHLYLTNKPGGFNDHDSRVVAALAAAAGSAIENAQLYQTARKREHWLAAGQEIFTMLLSGADEEEALATIAARAREVAQADTAVLVLPSVGGRLVMEIADGVDADELIGTVMPPEGRSQTVLREGIGMVIDSLASAQTLRVERLRQFGPAMYAPLQTSGRGVGVMLLLRRRGAPSFGSADLTTAESFATQAALALVLAEARHTADVETLFDERERIARDLHDLAIQQLFATGMQLETVRRRAARGVDPGELTTIISDALDNVDDTVRQIRAIVYRLRDPDADVDIVERLRREASLARTGLGFAPSLVVLADGRVLDADDEAQVEEFSRWIDVSLADDIVAVVREGLANTARHAKASSVQVTVSLETPETPQRGGRVRIEVADDGSGLPPVQSRRSGLANLAARAQHHKGTFTLSSDPEDPGAVLTWQVPLGPAAQ